MTDLERLIARLRDDRRAFSGTAEAREAADTLSQMRALISCALDEYEGLNGRVLTGNHWSIEARNTLGTTTKIEKE